MGHTTFVVCPLSSDKMKESEPGIYPIGPIHILKSYPSYSVVGKPVETLRKIESIVRLEKPDVIHSNTPLTIGLGVLHSSKIMNIPLIGSLHTLLPEMVKHYHPLRFKKLSEKLGWEIYYHYYDLCDQVTCPTLSIQKILCHRRIRKKIEIVPNGVNIQRFKPDMKAGKDIR